MAQTLASAGPGRSQRDFAPKTRFGPVAIVVMVVFHAVVGFALLTGLGKKAIEIVKKPITATIVEEVKLPPPPPPPKPIVKQELPKPQAPPPPAYVPPPDVAPPPAPPVPTITQVQSAAPVAPPPAAPPAPPAPEPAKPVSTDIAVACPKQVKPEVPQKAIDDGVSGTVRAEAHIRGGKVVEVRILSGPRVFHAAVRAAMSRYECVTSGDGEVLATQEFAFRVD